MKLKHFILATAGHVDHGKSALVKALTGTDPDRLPEEKARGITIELGFAHLQLGDTSLGIVDVPGHEDFVKNMVAGVGAIDLALLVVAADDGWMPQTEEHLQILTYLGVNRAVVAVTKSDLTTLPGESVRAQLDGTPFANAPIVPVSVKTGAGLENLKMQLARECESIPAPRDVGKPRLAVDRAFTLRGIGLVVTGTLSGGKLRRADLIVVQPSGRRGRIRGIQNHGREIEVSEPGMRTALNIPSLELARGNVVAYDGLGSASSVVDVLVTRSARLPANTAPLKDGSAIRVHHGTANCSARILFSSRQGLRPGETAMAELRLDAPIFAFAGDRFILRDPSEQNTLAGALVLDPEADPRKFRNQTQQQFLAARAQAPEDVSVFVRTQLRRDHVARRASLLLKSRFSKEEIQRATADARTAGEFICHRKWWNVVCGRAAALIDTEHKTHPNRVGLELPRLRDSLRREFTSAELFDALVAHLCAHGFTQANETIRRASHRPSLPPSLQSAGSRIRAALAVKPFDPPSRKELAPDSTAQEAVRFLRDTNEIVEISSDVILLRDAFERMRITITEALRANGGATLSDLRRLLGSSRRVVVPLLEYFDRAGLTRRVGDKRALVSPR